MQSKRPKPWLAITLTIFFIMLALVTWKVLIPTYFPETLPNYAQEVAKPLEAALTNAGAVKKCSTGDNGRGSDNDEPNYTAIYEIKNGPEDAVQLIYRVAGENGYNLTDQTDRINAGVNKLYIDESKKNPYAQLGDGNIKVGFDIYKDKTYSGGQFCGIEDRADLTLDITTVRISTSLPAFKQ